MKPNRKNPILLACLSLPFASALPALLFAPSVQAASDSWNVDAVGNWTTFGSWLSGTQAPGSTTLDNTDIATFGFTLTAGRIVTVDATRYIGGISFGNTSNFGYTLSGGSLILNNGGVIQTLAGNGNHTDTISSAIRISGTSAATAFFTANATSATSLLSIGAVTGSATSGNTTTLTLNGTNTGLNSVTGIIGNGSGGGTLALTKAGTGTWLLSGANSYTGATAINAGTLTISGASGAIASSASVTVGNATGPSGVLTLDNSTANNANRVGSVAMNFNNGTLNFIGNTTAASSETIGLITIAKGHNVVSLSGGAVGQVAVLTSTAAGGSRTAGATATIVVADSTKQQLKFTGGAIGIDKGIFYGATAATANDFAYFPGGSGAVVAPTYGTTTDFAAAATTLTTLKHNKLSGTIASTGAVASLYSINMPSNYSITALTGNLTFSNAADKGAIIKSGGGAAQIGTAGNAFDLVGVAAGELVFNTVDAADNLTLNVGITATTTTLTKTGAGTLTFTVNRDYLYTGATTINAGTLVLNSLSGNGVKSATITINNGGTAKFGASGKVENNTGITINAGGTLDLNAFSDLIGGIAGTGSITSADPATLSLSSGTRTFSGVISGAVALTVRDTAIQTLNSANTYTGATIIGGSGGTITPGVLILAVDNAMSQSPLDTGNSTLGTSSKGLKTTVTTLTMGGLTGNKNLSAVFTSATGGPSNVTANGGYSGLTALTFNPVSGATHSYSADIGIGNGSMSLTKSGLGTQDLSGTNSYTGATLVTTGALSLSGSGTVNLSSGITVDGSNAKLLQTSSNAITPTVTLTQGTVTGSGTVNNVNVAAGTGGIISNNNGVSGAALTIGNLTLAGAANLNLFSNTVSSNLNVTGTLTTAATPATLTANNNNFGGWTNGTAYTILTFGSIAGSGDNFTKVVNNLATRQAPTWNTTSNAITLTLSGDNPVWSGANGGTWTTVATNSPTSGTPNWALKNPPAATDFWAGDIVEFNDTYNIGAGNVPVTNSTATITGGVAPLSTTFNNSLVNYTINSSDSTGITAGSLTKNGTGNVTISTANSYNGATAINAGTITLSGSGTLGTGSALTLGGGKLDLGGLSRTVGAVSVTAPAASGDTIGNGSLTGTSYAASNSTGNAIISANLLVNGAAGFAKTGAGTVTLSGTNTYTGGTSIQNGTLQVNTGGTLGATTGAVTMGTGSAAVIGTVGSLIINTDNTIGSLAVASNTATSTGTDVGRLTIASTKTLTVSGAMTIGVASASNLPTITAMDSSGGGTLTVNGNFSMSPLGTVTGTQTPANTVVDLSGLGTFNNTNTGGSLTVGSSQQSNAKLTLASTANTINVSTLSIANSGGQNYSTAYSVLNLGTGDNTLQANTITIGASKGSGALQFAPSNTTGTVTITGTGGIGAAAITIGNASTATYSAATNDNALLLAGHSATVTAGAVIVGRNAGNSGGAPIARVTFDTGTFGATSITLANNASGSSTMAPTGTFTVGGTTVNSAATGVVNVSGNFLLASNLNTTAGTATGSLIINGGTVNVNTAASATGGILDNSTNTTGGSLTTLTLAGGTLNLNGGIIGGNGVSGSRAITNLNFQSGTLQNVLQINNGAGLTKSTDGTGGGGTLILSGTNSFTGGVTINAGTVQLGSVNAIRSNADTENAVTFGASSTGTLALAGNSVVVANLSTDASPGTTFVQNANGTSVSNATLTVGNATNASGTYAGTIQDGTGGTGTLALTKAGTGTLTLTAANSYSGGTIVSAGTLLVNNTSGSGTGSGAVSVSANGTLGGTGTISGALDVTGQLAPGGTGVDIQSLAAGTTTWNAGSIWNFDLSANSNASDVLDITGTAQNFTKGGTGTYQFNFMNSAPTTWGNVYTLVTWTGTTNFLASNFSYTNLGGAFDGMAGTGFTITGSSLTFTAVPEPTSASVGLLIGAGLLRRRRKC